MPVTMALAREETETHLFPGLRASKGFWSQPCTRAGRERQYAWGQGTLYAYAHSALLIFAAVRKGKEGKVPVTMVLARKETENHVFSGSRVIAFRVLVAALCKGKEGRCLRQGIPLHAFHCSDTALPLSAAVRKGKEGKVPVTMALAREETETALNVCIQHVLDRTGLKPHQVGGPCLPPSWQLPSWRISGVSCQVVVRWWRCRCASCSGWGRSLGPACEVLVQVSLLELCAWAPVVPQQAERLARPGQH